MIMRFPSLLAMFSLLVVCFPRPGAAEDPAAPVLTNRVVAGQGVALTWTSLGPGWDYAVQSRDALGNGLWLMIYGQDPWPTPQALWTDARPMEPRTRFYRLVAVPHAERGLLITSALARSWGLADINLLFSIAQIPLTAQYPVDVHKIVYETVDVYGGRTRASGILALPQGVGGPLPLLSYQHGTVTRTNNAPSSLTGQEVLVGVALATSGYAVTLPDYLGLGESPGQHPYQHARSEATASLDMLRSARAACGVLSVPLDGQVFICGYSQGGHATLALQREIETFHTNEFTLVASAPMAGAYDMSGVTLNDFLSGRDMPNPYYFAYLLAAYQEVYHFAETLADLLASPYNTTLPPLLQGHSTSGEINDEMPADPKLILKPEILAAFQADPQHPMRVALRDNDLYRWRPRSPTRLYHCSGDRDVIFANSEVARDAFRALGATQVSLIDPSPGANHGDCVLPSMLSAKQWFDQLRQ